MQYQVLEPVHGALCWPTYRSGRAWDLKNEFVANLYNRFYASKMRKLCVNEVISYSRDVYIERLTGTLQKKTIFLLYIHFITIQK